MDRLFNRFYHALPVRAAGSDDQVHLLNAAERRRLRHANLLLMALGAGLSIAGFLAYYLPLYRYPQFFPALAMPLGVRLPWAELLWCVLLSLVEIWLLTLLNLAGVHETAVAVGWLTPATKGELRGALLAIGLEQKSDEARRYGIDPFQGLQPWLLLLANLLLRLKGWLANQVVRQSLRVLLGRYAVRTLLDFAGMPIYMALNAWSVYAVMREARVIIMGQVVVRLLLERLPPRALPPREQALLYDTLQFIAISKRDFHQTHALLTRELLARFGIPVEAAHPLPEDYYERLRQAPERTRALCQLVIRLGFMLDGNLSWRERRRLRALNERGVLPESYAELRQAMRDFLAGRGIEAWCAADLASLR